MVGPLLVDASTLSNESSSWFLLAIELVLLRLLILFRPYKTIIVNWLVLCMKPRVRPKLKLKRTQSTFPHVSMHVGNTNNTNNNPPEHLKA